MKDLSLFWDGLKMVVHQHSGFLDSSSPKLSSQVQDRTLQESMLLLLMSYLMTLKSMMRLSQKMLLKNLLMEFIALVFILKELGGIRLLIC